MAYEVEVKEVTAQPAAVVRFTAAVPEMGEHLGRAFTAAMAYIQSAGATIAGPPFAYYEQLGDQRFAVRAGFPVQAPLKGEGEVEPFELPGGRVVSTLHVGSYARLMDAYDAITTHAAEQGLQVDPGGASWEAYLSGPEVPPEQTQTLVYCPVKRSGESD
jgi:effector-binding domain-containing protein